MNFIFGNQTALSVEIDAELQALVTEFIAKSVAFVIQAGLAEKHEPANRKQKTKSESKCFSESAPKFPLQR